MQLRPIQPPARQPPDREDAEEAAEAALIASLTREDAALVIAIASAGGDKGYVRPRGSTLSGLRRLRELGLIDLALDTRGETVAAFTPLGVRAVPHALKLRVGAGSYANGAKGGLGL